MPRAQGDPLGRVPRERVEARGAHAASRGVCEVAGEAEDRDGRDRPLVEQRGQEARVLLGPLDEHDGRPDLGDQRGHRDRAGGTVVAHPDEVHTVALAQQREVVSRLAKPRRRGVPRGAQGYRHRSPAAVRKSFQRASDRARSRTTLST
ncbi:Uncharacterised protein [Mycobacteroides abscessus]|nr:Uncharacterised protein [Mycobacteroides abscessus]